MTIIQLNFDNAKNRKRIVYVDEIDGYDEQSEPEMEPEITEEEIKEPLLKKLRKEPKKNKT